MKNQSVNSLAVCLSLLMGGWFARPSQSMTAQPSEASQQRDSTISQRSNSNVLLYCVTESGKEISLYDQGDTIEYSFGFAGQPEITLTRLREDTSTYQWAGVGRSIHYSVDVPNGDTVYSVFWSYDRLSPQQEEIGGVNVMIDGQYVATVSCGSGEIVQNLRGVDLPPTRY